MLRSDHIALVQLRLEVRDFQDLLGLLGQWYVARRECAARAANRVFDRLAQLEQVTSEIAEDFDCDSFAFPDDAQQQVLGADIVMPEAQRLLPAIPDHIAPPV